MPSSYISVNGKAKKVKKIYYGVNGVAKAVKSIFCGIGGIAKNVFASQADGAISFSVPKWTRFALATDDYCFFGTFETVNKDAELSVINKKYTQIKRVTDIPKEPTLLKFNNYAMIAGGIVEPSTYTPTNNVSIYTDNLTTLSTYLSKGRYSSNAAVVNGKYAVFVGGFIADERDDTTFDVFDENLVRVVSGKSAKYLYYNFQKMGVASFDKYAVFGGGNHLFGDNNEEMFYIDDNLIERNACFSHEGGYCVAASNNEHVIFIFTDEDKDNAFNKNFVRTVTYFRNNANLKYDEESAPQAGVSTERAAIFLSLLKNKNKSFCVFGCNVNLLASYSDFDYYDKEYVWDYNYSYHWVSSMVGFNGKLVVTNQASTSGIAFNNSFR